MPVGLGILPRLLPERADMEHETRGAAGSTWGRQSTPTQIRHIAPSPTGGEFGKLHPFLPRKMERSDLPRLGFSSFTGIWPK